VDSVKYLLNYYRDLVRRFEEAGVTVSETIKKLLDECASIIARMRYVKYGDYVLAEDHNLLVDAVKKLLQVADNLSQYARPPEIRAEYALYTEYVEERVQGISEEYEVSAWSAEEEVTGISEEYTVEVGS